MSNIFSYFSDVCEALKDLISHAQNVLWVVWHRLNHPYLAQFSSISRWVFCDGRVPSSSPFCIIGEMLDSACTAYYLHVVGCLVKTVLLTLISSFQAQLSIYKRPSTCGVAC